MRKFILLSLGIGILLGNVHGQSEYPISDHYDGKNFFNPGKDNDLKSLWQVLKWKLTSSPAEWPLTIPIKNYPLRTLAPQEKFSLTFINHATFLIQFQGLNVLTDPVYSERVSPFSSMGPKRVREAGIPFDILPEIHVVLVSHNHYDHMDIETLKRLDKKFHPLFLVPLGDEKHLRKAGLQNVKAMDWWEEVKVKDTRFVFTPARHWSARWLWDKNESLWGSFMIFNNDKKIYHGGDTGYSEHFLAIKSRLGPPDVALLPVGAYEPRWFMKNHHMNPSEAIKAHIDLGAIRSIGMHFGTFQLTDEGIDDPEKDLKAAREAANLSENEFTILDQGQGLAFP